MEFCSQHGDCSKKIWQNCNDLAGIKERMSAGEEQIERINLTIFGEGGGETLKSRLQRAEDAVSGLKESVLENRQLIKDGLQDLTKAAVKAIVILVSIATVVVGGMFGLLWTEIKSVQVAKIEVNR